MDVRRNRIVLVGALALASAGLVWAAMGSAGGGSARGRAGDELLAADAASSALAGVESRANGASEGDDGANATAAAVEANQRRAPAPEAAPAPPAAPTQEVMGVVSDPRGAPIAGVRVWIAAPRPRPADALSRASTFSSGAMIESRVTGPDGGFVFEGSDLRASGVLTYGEEYLLGGKLTVQIDTDATYQVLTIPDPEVRPVTWSIRVEDEAGEPLAPEVIDLRFGGGEVGAHARAPRAEERMVQFGLVQQRVSPGRWILEVASPESLVQQLIAEIPAESAGETFESVVVLPRVGLAEASELAADADGRPWLDPAQGLDAWLPEEELLLALGEDTRDRHFAATFRAPGGPVRAAQLYLDLEANSGMSSNDGIYLDPNARHEYAWSNRISSLTGGRWQRGMRRRLRVDLSKLPSADGGTVDLLSALEDGRLTVVIQDDTVVHAARLRVVR